jgi:hypothetical protein
MVDGQTEAKYKLKLVKRQMGVQNLICLRRVSSAQLEQLQK